MEFNSNEFTNTLKKNFKANLIPKGTEFEVTNAKGNYIGIVAVQRTTIVYLSMPKVPDDLLVGDYHFKEITDSEENENESEKSN